MPRKTLPWWAEELAQEWTDDGRPVLRADVLEVELVAQGRKIPIAYYCGPVEIPVNWAVYRDPHAPYGVCIKPGEDPLAAVLAIKEPEPVWSLDPPEKGWPWWARQLGDPSELAKFQRFETRYKGRKALVLVGEPRRALGWTARRGVVGEDGVWYSGSSGCIAPDVDPVAHIQAQLDRVKSKDGRPVQPWESDVDGMSPGRLPPERPRRRRNPTARHGDRR